MKQILEQLSTAWTMAGTIYDRAESDSERAEIKKRMDRIASLMEETMSKRLSEHDEMFRQATATFKKNKKDIEQFERNLERPARAIQFLIDIVARVDALLRLF